MLLRNVHPGDLEAYVRMRCDPVMMAELGGPQPREGIEAKVASDIAATESGEAWVLMVVPDEARPEVVAGSVVIWSHEDEEAPGAQLSEAGWMILPEFQGRGLAKQAVRAMLERAREEGRWGPVHAFPGATNGPSNGICRSLGFTLVGRRDVDFAGRLLHTNHWRIDPRTDLAG